MARVWRGTVVEEGNLKFQVGALRRALGDGRGGRRYIATSAGQGYRFVAPVSVAQAPAAAPLPAAPTRQLHNLPQQLTRLIGRADAVSRIVARLQRHRLLSIVGPGGIGKTAVALAVAEASVNTHEHGVWFVDLAPLADARLVPSAVAQVIGFDIRSDDPVPGLVGALRDRRLLLVLDNCEHVIEAAATLAVAILRGAAGVQILATSREPLRVEGRRRGLSQPATRLRERLELRRATAAFRGRSARRPDFRHLVGQRCCRAYNIADNELALDAGRDEVAHLPHLLEIAGTSTTAAIAAAVPVGPAQVAARLAEFGALRIMLRAAQRHSRSDVASDWARFDELASGNFACWASGIIWRSSGTAVGSEFESMSPTP